MMHTDSAPQKPALLKGLGVLIGECVVGLNGPFMFSRFGLNVPEAVATGVVLGAIVGYTVAALGWQLRHRAPKPAMREAPADAQLHAH